MVADGVSISAMVLALDRRERDGLGIEMFYSDPIPVAMTGPADRSDEDPSPLSSSPAMGQPVLLRLLHCRSFLPVRSHSFFSLYRPQNDLTFGYPDSSIHHTQSSTAQSRQQAMPSLQTHQLSVSISLATSNRPPCSIPSLLHPKKSQTKECGGHADCVLSS